MKTHTITAFFAALIVGSALTLSATAQPAACPLKDDSAKQTCNHNKKPCCEKADANCCEKDKACADCPQCPAGKSATAEAKTCPVSGEKLGSMGEPYAYTYKEAGKPDRTILLCCKMCVKSFEKNPAQYLAKLDAAQE